MKLTKLQQKKRESTIHNVNPSKFKLGSIKL